MENRKVKVTLTLMSMGLIGGFIAIAFWYASWLTENVQPAILPPQPHPNATLVDSKVWVSFEAQCSGSVCQRLAEQQERDRVQKEILETLKRIEAKVNATS